MRRKLVRIVVIVIGGVAVSLAGLAAWYEITTYRPQRLDAGPTLLTGSTVLAGPELTPLQDTDVLIEDGRITDIGPALADAAPAGTTVHDLRGMTLLPGLIDLHVHLGREMKSDAGPPGLLDFPGLLADYARYLPDARRSLLAAGVTTVRDLGNEAPFIFELRDGIDGQSLEGPRVLAAGLVFTTPGGHPVQTVHGGDAESSPALTPGSPQEAREEVRRLSTQGVDVIKVIQERGGGQVVLDPIPVEILEAIVDEAHALELRVVAHWGRQDDLTEVLAAGVDELVHLESRDLMEGWPGGLLDEVLASGIVVTPSVVVAEQSLPGDLREPLIRQSGDFHEAGGTLLAGSDSGMPGVGFGSGLHRELELLVEAGLSPSQALRAATSASADHLGLRDLGEVREGAIADLVVVDGEPHQNIRDISQVRLVLRDGRVVSHG